MAERLGVRISTFSEWKHLHAELAEAIKRGRDRFVSVGMDALEVTAIARAAGYMVTEAETVTEDGPRGQFTRTKTTVSAEIELTHRGVRTKSWTINEQEDVHVPEQEERESHRVTNQV